LCLASPPRFELLRREPLDRFYTFGASHEASHLERLWRQLSDAARARR